MTVTNEAIPYYEHGADLPCEVKTGKTVLGKHFVIVGADMEGDPNGLTDSIEGGNIIIEPATAKSQFVLGVASVNAAEKTKVTVKSRPGLVMPVVAGGAIAHNEPVGVGAEGKAVKAEASSKAEIEEGKGPWKVPPVGLAVADAAEGVDCPVKLF